jgi:hypothetical protein
MKRACTGLLFVLLCFSPVGAQDKQMGLLAANSVGLVRLGAATGKLLAK